MARAVSERAYSWTGADLGERTLYLWGAAVGHQNRGAALKMRLFRTLRRERMFSTFSQNEELWKRIYEYASQSESSADRRLCEQPRGILPLARRHRESPQPAFCPCRYRRR